MFPAMRRNMPIIGWAQQIARFPAANKFAIRNNHSLETAAIVQEHQPPRYDKLFRKIDLEWRGHDRAVLKSYLTYVQNVCNLLDIDKSEVQVEPYQRWLVWVCKSKFAKKKYKYHYETRTHIRKMSVLYLTGSTASTFLEYIERNLPEGVAMKCRYTEMCPIPETITIAEDAKGK